jgi:hypothetical protein
MLHDHPIQGFEGKTLGNETLGTSRRGWEDNIKVDIQEVRWGARDWMLWHRIKTGVGANACGPALSSLIKCGNFLIS